jgi:hypothetical protein
MLIGNVCFTPQNGHAQVTTDQDHADIFLTRLTVAW